MLVVLNPPIVVARLEVGGGELGDGGVHLLDVVQSLGGHPGLGRGLGHELVHRPLLLTRIAPGNRDVNVQERSQRNFEDIAIDVTITCMSICSGPPEKTVWC